MSDEGSRDDTAVTRNPWQGLRRFTNARIALGRAGDSLPTSELLTFQLDHARARDAVHLPFDTSGVGAQVEALGYEVLQLHSAAESRSIYLQRPDLGRRLSDRSRQLLQERVAASDQPYAAAFVIGDGLSAIAAHRHAVPLLHRASQALEGMGWHLAPVVIASQARVALGDAVGELLRAELVAVLIGERPGLSVADSLGVYLTYRPQVGRSDAERNCVSNIHRQGLSYAEAQRTLVYLMSEARRRRLTGVALKDDRRDADGRAHLLDVP